MALYIYFHEVIALQSSGARSSGFELKYVPKYTNMMYCRC